MPELRDLLAGAGFDDVRTYVQSGNVVLSTRASPEQVARKCEQQVAAHFGLDIPVVVRTRDELAEVVQGNPFGNVAVNPKRYQVTFMTGELDRETVRRLEVGPLPRSSSSSAAVRSMRGTRRASRDHGCGRSLAGPGLGITATARNWTTVTKLLALADE